MVANTRADITPLIDAMRDLVVIHDEAAARASDLIAAIIANRPAQLEEAAAAQVRVAQDIEDAEERRQVAEREFVGQLGPHSSLHGRKVTTSLLLTILPEDDATALRQVRHDLLMALVRLQAVNRQAALLLHRAQSFMSRVVQNAVPAPSTYTSAGTYANVGGSGGQTRQV